MSAASTASTSAPISSLTSTTLSSPTSSSTLSNNMDASCSLAATTEAGIAPSPGRVPVNLPLENIAAHAASPYSFSATRRAVAYTPSRCGAMPASRAIAPGEVSGTSTATALARLPASPVLLFSATSFAV
eukprot:4326171-Pleurochrysis_carterae.AAC.1